MPNILEQQDLLKGLPDDRLSMLMQNPTGDIPPFLVAAEAQRRQSIREQFSGGPQESVVDTLTKQMANVPQNIQAPAQQPPQMPPPQMAQDMQQPEAGGINALQQGMRVGGYVRRYAPGGLAEASIYAPSNSAAEQMAKTYMMMNPGMSYEEALQRASIGQPLPAATVGEVAAAQAAKVGEGMSGVGNYSVLRGNQLAPVAPVIEEQSAGVAPQPTTPKASPYQYGMTGDERRSMPMMSPSVGSRDPNAGKADSSLENQAKTYITVDEYKAYLERSAGTSAEDSEYIRAKLKELYGGQETSDWEKAQKWFAAAQAAVQPNQTSMQAAISALSAFGGGFAQERAAERENQQALAEALLRQDIADRQAAREDRRDIEKGVMDFRIAEAERARASRATQDERRLEASKYSASEETRTAEMYLKAAERAEDDFRRAVESLTKGVGVSQEEAMKDPEIIRLQKRAQEYYRLHNDALAAAELGRKRYGDLSGVDFSFETATGEGPITRSRK